MAMGTTELPNARPKETRELKWSIPRWSKARDLKKLVPMVFGAGPIIRIVGVSIIVGAAICWGVKFAFPQIQLGIAWKALFAIPAMFAYLGIWFLTQLLVPGQVKINEKYIFHSTGQSGWRINLADIELAKLIIFSPDHIRLIIRAPGKVRKLAVPSTVDLRLLISLLSPTAICDRQRQFDAARKLFKDAPASEDATANTPRTS